MEYGGVPMLGIDVSPPTVVSPRILQVDLINLLSPLRRERKLLRNNRSLPVGGDVSNIVASVLGDKVLDQS